MKSFFNIDRLKFNGYIFIILVTIILMILYINYSPPATTYETSFQKAQNVMSQEPFEFNDIQNDFLFYHPKKYLVVNRSDLTVNMEEDNAVFTLFFGNDEQVESDYLSSINQDLTVLFEYSEQTDEGLKYFYIWEYPTENNEQYIQVMIGINNRYIAGVFSEKNKDKYITEMSYIFNSIKELDESNPEGEVYEY